MYTVHCGSTFGPFRATLLLRTTRMRSQRLGGVSSVVALEKNKQTNTWVRNCIFRSGGHQGTFLMTPTTALGMSIRLSVFEFRETGDWDIFLGPPERASAQTGRADQWVLKRKELPGFAIVNEKKRLHPWDNHHQFSIKILLSKKKPAEEGGTRRGRIQLEPSRTSALCLGITRHPCDKPHLVSVRHPSAAESCKKMGR